MRYVVAIAIMMAITSPAHAADLTPVQPSPPPRIEIVPSAFDASGGDKGPDSLAFTDPQDAEQTDAKKPDEAPSVMASSATGMK
jgi:hypothetical protein